jgi:thermitase
MNRLIKTILTVWLAIFFLATQSQLTSQSVTRADDSSSAVSAQGVSEMSRMRPQSVPGRLLVKYREGVSSLSRNSFMMAAGVREERELPGLGVHVMQLPDGMDEQAYAQALRLRPEVEFAEPDYLVYPVSDVIPDDPMYSSQWHLPAVSCPTAWGITMGSDQITIALCDTGVDGTHPDLAAKLVPGWNVFDNNADTSPVNPHGTWTAGTAAATGNNEIGVASPALNCRIMPVRVTSQSDGAALISALAAGVVWAADHGAQVASVSYMGADTGLMASAGRYIESKGGVLVMAAGNTNSYFGAPDTPDIIVVSGTDQSDQLAWFTTTGSYVDVSAPGTGILTTSPGGTYQAVNGTSFSTPLVAGAAALMLSVNPNLTPAQIDTILKVTADDLGPAGWDPGYGWGRLNVGRAINTVEAMLNGAPDITPPALGFAQPQIGGPSSGLVGISGGELLQVNALDDRGVTQVSLFADGAPLGTNTSAPYNFNWDTSLLAPGSQHILIAVATDQAGNTKNISTTVTLSASFDATPPVVSFAQPQANGQVNISTGEPVLVSASDNRGVVSVSLFADGYFVGTDTTAPYTFKWDTSSFAIGSQHTLLASVGDQANNWVSTSITVTARAAPDTTPPSVSFVQPQQGGTVNTSTGEPVTVSASDNVGVASVSLYADGTLISTKTSAPYAFTLNTSGFAGGSQHALTATATDQAGNSTSVSITITVNPPPDVTPPTVSFVQPLANESVGESRNEPIRLSAQDNVGVASVSLLGDGALLGRVYSAPYTFSWDTSSFAIGSRHLLTAVAADQAGNSTIVSITVSVRDTISPQVSFISPENGQRVSGHENVLIRATDNVAVTRVDFSADNQLVTSWSRPPYSMKWNTDRLARGAHTLTCTAYDAAGNSASRSITVTAR